MPILPREPDIYPADLLEPKDGPATTSGVKWWAVYTIARREKDLMRRLRKMAIAHYSPMVKKRNRSTAGRVRTSYVPLFPGYVFLLADEEQRYRATTTNCISQCLPVVDGEALAHDLRQIYRLIQADVPLLPEEQIEAGTRVRIRSGALIGLEGVVLKRRGQDRLMVAVEFLQRGASVLLEDFEVERVDG